MQSNNEKRRDATLWIRGTFECILNSVSTSGVQESVSYLKKGLLLYYLLLLICFSWLRPQQVQFKLISFQVGVGGSHPVCTTLTELTKQLSQKGLSVDIHTVLRSGNSGVGVNKPVINDQLINLRFFFKQNLCTECVDRCFKPHEMSKVQFAILKNYKKNMGYKMLHFKTHLSSSVLLQMCCWR